MLTFFIPSLVACLFYFLQVCISKQNLSILPLLQMARTRQTTRKRTRGRFFARRTPVEPAPAHAPPAPAPAQPERRSLQAGISEADRRALSRICHIFREKLATSQFRFFPRHSRGAASAQIPLPPPEERNPTMDATQELVAALSTDLDAAGVEWMKPRMI